MLSRGVSCVNGWAKGVRETKEEGGPLFQYSVAQMLSTLRGALSTCQLLIVQAQEAEDSGS